MSCFIVSRDNITCAVALFEEHRKNHGTKPGDLGALGRQLWKMNAAAFFERYEENVELEYFRYRKGDAARFSPIQKIKAAQCLFYNCSEGKVKEFELFFQLERAIASAENYFLCTLPSYAEAQWDIRS